MTIDWVILTRRYTVALIVHIPAHHTFGLSRCVDLRAIGTQVLDGSVCEDLVVYIWWKPFLNIPKKNFHHQWPSETLSVYHSNKLNSVGICCVWHYHCYPSQPELDMYSCRGVNELCLVWVNTLEHHAGIALLLEVDEISVVSVYLNVLKKYQGIITNEICVYR